MKKVVILTLMLCDVFLAVAQHNNTLSDNEKSAGWILLFDGKTFTGWRGYCKPGFPEKGWVISDEAIQCVSGINGGDIIFDKKFDDFELYFEWKISENGNGGLLYRVQEIPGKKMTYSGPQIQTLDNERNSDAQRGTNGNHQAGSLYDLLPAIPQNTKPSGEWNTFLLTVKKQKVTHVQNGEKICEYTIGSPEWKKMVADSSLRDYTPLANIAAEGYIGLQDHGDDAWYRNIKIRIINIE